MARVLLEKDATFRVKETDLPLECEPDRDAVYTLRPFSSAVARELGKKHTTQEFDPKSHRRIDVVNSASLNDAVIDYVIADWSGVNGPCTTENKLKLPVPVQKALLDRAQVGNSAEVRADSFLEPA